MRQYQDLLRHVSQKGKLKEDRTGTGTVSIFGYQMRFDLEQGFPLVTTKKIHFKSVVHELLWFLKGDTNTKYLVENNVKIWNEWADDNGDLGPVYGSQWRNWPTPSGESIDQVKHALGQIQKNPNSRRIIISAWNPADLPDETISPQENVKKGKMALAPCHTFMQFYVDGNRLSCQMYQRSADIFLGVPFNIAGYSLLTMMIAQVCGLKPGDFIHTLGDAHIYSNLKEQIKLQLSRKPHSLPTLKLNKDIKNLFDFKFEDFQLIDYEHHPHIKGKVAV